MPTATFSQDGKPTPFAEVVKENFSQWDENGDSKLSKEEIASAVGKEKFHGEAAAAIAAIERVVSDSKYKLTPVSEALLISGNNQHPRAFANEYLVAVKKLHQASRELFPQSLPSLDSIQQDDLGDCYFLSVVGAMVHRNPSAVKSMFTKNDDGSTGVKFGNGREVKVLHVTDADIAICSTAGNNGLWLTVLVKAFRNVKVDAKHPDDPDRYDRISNGGYSGPVIRKLDGCQSRQIDLKGNRLGVSQTANLLRENLITAFRKHRLVVAGTDKKIVPGIPDEHEYAILAYNDKTEMLHIWNPWGDNFTPKGSDGLQNGYTRRNGEFDIPLRDFVKVYSEITFETQAE